MRASYKIILIGMVLAPLIFTCSSFPGIKDTYAYISDTNHVDGTISAALWDTQNSLIGLSDLRFLKNSTTTQGVNQGIKGTSPNNGSSDNSMNNTSSSGNDTSNLTNQTVDDQRVDNQTVDNQTVDNQTNNNIGGGSFGPSGPEKTSAVFPVANFSSNITSGYAPLSIQFTDLAENATQWNWDFGDGDTSTERNPIDHTYSRSGTYNINLIVTNENGTNSKTITITVLEKPVVILPPVANFSISTTVGFIPLSVQFTDFSENATQWNWDFGDGNTSTEQNPEHIYSTAGDYDVKLTVTNPAGTDNETKNDFVKVRIASSIKLTSITLDGENSTGATTSSGTYTTNTGDTLRQVGIKDETGAFLNQPYASGSLGEVSIPLAVGINNFTLVADGVFTGNENYGTLLFFDGATTPPQAAVYNSNGGTGKFSVQPLGTRIAGSVNGDLLLEKAPGSSVYSAPDGTKLLVESFVVDSKSGSADEVSGENIGSNGIPDTTAKLSLYVTTSSIVTAPGFSASPTSGNAPLKVVFTDSSTGFPTSRKWLFGDGTSSTEQNPVHTFSTAGNYTVTLAASNANGTNSTFSTITVLQPVLPLANFSSNVTSGSVPLSVQFTDFSKNTAHWDWNFGDGNNSIEQNPAHIYNAEGNYTVTLTASNTDGKSTKTCQISVDKNLDNSVGNSTNNS